MSTYTAALVGCGDRGREHLEAYDLIADAAPVACMAPSPERRQPLAAEFGLEAYDDLAAMLAAEDPDLVHLATPPDVRVEPMRRVAEAGVPACTVEKPVAVGVGDWRAIRDLRERADTRFAVCHQFRWHPDLVRCREAVASGTIGPIRLLDASARLVITDQGTHCLHYANALNGDARIASVFGAASGPYRTDQMHPGPVATEAQITFENGTRCLWATGRAAPRVESGMAEYQHKRAAAHGEHGHALWEQFGDWEVAAPHREERGDYGGAERWAETNRAAQAAFHEAMLEWIEDDDAAPGTHLERSLHEWKAVLALYASALRCERVVLDEFSPPDDLVGSLATALG